MVRTSGMEQVAQLPLGAPVGVAPRMSRSIQVPVPASSIRTAMQTDRLLASQRIQSDRLLASQRATPTTQTPSSAPRQLLAGQPAEASNGVHYVYHQPHAPNAPREEPQPPTTRTIPVVRPRTPRGNAAKSVTMPTPQASQRAARLSAPPQSTTPVHERSTAARTMRTPGQQMGAWEVYKSIQAEQAASGCAASL